MFIIINDKNNWSIQFSSITFSGFFQKNIKKDIISNIIHVFTVTFNQFNASFELIY